MNYEVIIAIILGVLLCFFGYRLKKIAFFIAWFIIGFILTTNLMPWLIENVSFLAEPSIWRNLVPIFGGLLLSLLGFAIEKFCLSLLCLIATIVFAVNNFGLSIQVFSISAVVGAVFGVLSIKLIKPATIIITSVGGAYILTLALATIITGINLTDYLFIAVAIIGGFGLIFQFLTTKNMRR